MSKIEYFKILLDKSTPIYTPGERLTGRVLIGVLDSVQIKSIRLIALGECKIHWTEVKTKPGFRGARIKYNQDYKSQEHLLNTEIVLLSNVDGHNLQLENGEHSYFVEFYLPDKLMTSFEHAHGKVRYSIQGLISCSNGLEKSTKQAFSVVDHLDLNKVPKLTEPYGVSADKIICCGLCASDPIECHFSIQKRGFVCGENLKFEIFIENQSSREIKTLQVTLVQRIRFQAQKDSKIVSREIVTAQYTKKIGAKSKETWNGYLTVKPTCSSSTNNSNKLINVSYVLICYMDASGISTGTNLIIPITIGTVPIRESVNESDPSPIYQRWDMPLELEQNEEEDVLPPYYPYFNNLY